MRINLESISEYEFNAYVEKSIMEYAKEKVKSGNWKEEESLDKSRAVFGTLLPEGIHTKGHSVMSIVDKEKGKSVGVLWVEWHNREFDSAYIWDLVIYENYRRMGYGQAAMQELENLARINQCRSIVLHVFGHNKPAIYLYEKLGYLPTNIIMKKEL